MFLTVCSLIFFIAGCAAVTASYTIPGDERFNSLVSQHAEKAAEYEKKGDLRKALQSWEVVNEFRPEDGGALSRIIYLKSQIQKTASDHYNKGVVYFQNNSMKAALREFLLALSLNPDHKEALDYVKYRMNRDGFITYEVKKGDTAKVIAQKVFNDSSKDFLIAYFNDSNKETRLAPGTMIVLPSLKTVNAAPGAALSDEEAAEYINVKQETRKARDLFGTKKYQQAAYAAEKILEYDPVNKDAMDVKNASYYEMGCIFKIEKKNAQALAMFNNVDPDYKDAGYIADFLKNTDKNRSRAAEYYIRGVNYYLNQDIDKAIKEWETTLKLDPDHPNAKKDLENARSFLEKLNNIKQL